MAIRVKVNTKRKLRPVTIKLNSIKLASRKAMGRYVDSLNVRLKSNCPAPSLSRAFYVSSTIDKTGRQTWFIGIKELPSVSSRKGWSAIKNEYSTYQKVMAVEYGRPVIPRTGKAPLFSSVSNGHGGVQRYMGTLKGVSPKARELRDSKPSVLIRVGPFAAVPPTFFIKDTVAQWEAELKIGLIKEIDSLLAKQKKK